MHIPLEKKNNKHFLLLFSIVMLVTVCILMSPLFFGELIAGDDLKFHLLRIESLKDTLLTGQFPARINITHLQGYGYASSLCYPDLFLYIPALLRIVGLPIETSYIIFILLIVSATFFSAYFCGKQITKSKYSGIITAIIYSLYQYHTTNIYVRAALGEILAMIFIPIAILGLYNLLFETLSKPVYLGIGFVGLFYCHTLTFYMLFLLAVGLCICFFPKLRKQAFPYKTLCLTICVSILLCLAFFLPFLEQLLAQDFASFCNTPSIKYIPMGVPIWQLFALPLATNHESGIMYTVGFLPIIVCVMRFSPAIKSASKEKKRVIDFLLLTGFVLLFISTNIFPWKYFQWLLKYIQFSWRIFSIAPLFLAVAIGYMSELFFKKTSIKLVFLPLLIASLFCYSLLADYTSTNKTIYRPISCWDFTKTENTFFIGCGEWLPYKTDKNLLKDTPNVLTSANQKIDYTKTGTNVQFFLESSKDIDYIDIPLLYYIGYQATVISEDGSKEILPITKNNNNTIRIVTSKPLTGTIIVEYYGTFIQKVSFPLSLSTLIIIVIYFGFKDKSKASTR